ncbi:uncharacterized protein BJ171DRAFT_496325 [Polychytrium aggregatum]|uniref:uncharacterized protein n=1 Tax=Polychytrium aggregatum TaxID=110093 RepID=UPI0022FE4E11|nr:uncharacterized protein BJ171DRAFT_496325 [Polychytrium aggregatum]KAI9206608.1 hypothetical protein BJ171DRAFT_496325 [Polychytrium aggregatum]
MAIGDVPLVPPSTAVLVAFVNIFAPGIGTLILGFSRNNSDVVLTGILQLLATFLVFGWIWAIVWSWFLYTKSKNVIELL